MQEEFKLCWEKWCDDNTIFREKINVCEENGLKFVKPMDFYRFIFPVGSFEEIQKQQQQKPNGILTVIRGDKSYNRIVFDDLKEIEQQQGKEFVIMSPISYVGKQRTAANARFLYAFAIDIDEVGEREMRLLLDHFNELHGLPRATFIVISGRGIHLYYVLDKPLPLYSRNQERIRQFKYGLTKWLWNPHTSKIKDNQIQYQGIFQGFRMPGTQSKIGSGVPVAAYQSGDRVSLEYLQSYNGLYKLGNLRTYKPSLTIEQAQIKYPKWYQSRIKDGVSKGRWHVKRALYDWWKNKILSDGKVGHRYFCLSVMATYAVKCDIDINELKKDFYNIQKNWNERDKNKSPLTDQDLKDALKFYKESFKNFPRTECEKLSNISMPANKRNYRPQKLHLAGARAIQKVNDEFNNKNWRDGNGRKPKKEIVLRWKKYNPDGRKIDCIIETGLSKPTVYKWWNYKEPEQ